MFPLDIFFEYPINFFFFSSHGFSFKFDIYIGTLSIYFYQFQLNSFFLPLSLSLFLPISLNDPRICEYRDIYEFSDVQNASRLMPNIWPAYKHCIVFDEGGVVLGRGGGSSV